MFDNECIYSPVRWYEPIVAWSEFHFLPVQLRRGSKLAELLRAQGKGLFEDFEFVNKKLKKHRVRGYMIGSAV